MKGEPRGSQENRWRIVDSLHGYIYNDILKKINSIGIIPSTNHDPIAAGDWEVKSLFWLK